MEIGKIKTLAKNMIEADETRDNLLNSCDAAFNSEWDLPPGLQGKSIHKVITTDAHDAVRKGQQAVASNKMQFIIPPLSGGDTAKGRYNMLEKAISHLVAMADRRSGGNLLDTLALNSILYAMVAGRVVYLPHEIAAREAFDGSTERLKYAPRFGPFAITLYHPRDVHVRFSDWMPEAMLTKRVLTVPDAISFWGKLAKPLTKMTEDTDYESVTIFDYATLEKRWVWAVPNMGRTVAGVEEAGVTIMENESTGLPFMPWFARYYGTLTAVEGRSNLLPMLKSVVESGQWEDSNMYSTLFADKIISMTYKPTLIEEGPNPTQTEINYDEKGETIAKAAPGNTLKANPEQTIDQGHLMLAGMMRDSINKSTVAEVFQTGAYPSGTGVGTVQQVAGQVAAGFISYQKLVERALSDIGQNILSWIAFQGEALVVDAVDGNRIVIDPKDLAIDYMRVDCELIPDVPLDPSAANAAQLYRASGGSEETALELMNVQDPMGEVKKRRKEQIEEVVFQNSLKVISAQGDAEAQRIMLGVQQEAMMAQQQQEMNANNQAVAQEAQAAQMASQGMNTSLGAESPQNNGAPIRQPR